MASNPMQTVEVAPGHELRLAVPFGQALTIQCVAGYAEIAGFELADKIPYELSGFTGAVYSHHGCKLNVSALRPLKTGPGAPKLDADAPPMPLHVVRDCNVTALANLNLRLDKLRSHAAKSVGQGATADVGPRIMVVGPRDSGKTTIVKTLANYAVKGDWTPLFVDLNPENPSVSISGTMAAMPVTHPLDPTSGQSLSSPATVAAGIAAHPLIFWYGYDQLVPATGAVGDHAAFHYLSVARQVARAVARKCELDTNVRTAGCLIDTPGGLDADRVVELVRIFNATHVLVTGDADLLVALDQLAATDQLLVRPSPLAPLPTRVTVQAFPRVPGAHARDAQTLKYAHIHRIREYFYGSPTASRGLGGLTPHNIAIPPTTMTVVRVDVEGGEEMKTTGAEATQSDGEKEAINDPMDVAHVEGAAVAPQGATVAQPDSATADAPRERKLKLVPVTDGNLLVHSVLALSSVADSERGDADAMATRNVMGFVYVSDFNEKTKKLSMLIPFPGRLPKKNFLLGNIKWIELS
ncbi:Cleavage polyadenylation factor subunit clp1 [Allomyces javanicus]|nr:Cleavage polyadenylation factor subunit clp1 [Allomyces javanicus]